jgi:IPT/TIG domain
MLKFAFVIAIVFQLTRVANAGGPAYVAGASYFDPSTMESPLTWAQGTISYYTDQGDLGAARLGASADTFVANAFSMWTSIPTAALSATHSGQLAEDVSGLNLSVANRVITTPADIAPTATGTPIGIVYDQDGSVTDDLLGAGASNIAYCAQNSVFGGVDNFGTNAQFLHALIILNGTCAQSSSQLPDLQYHLVRIIGRVLGLDWSQANVNVLTGKPAPVATEIAGLPVMHEFDPPSCVPVASCYSNNGTVNPAQPKMDDQAALSRLYPVTTTNVANFPGKKVFSQVTARIHGSVYFTDANGAAGQPMQGVNVVARWIDPSTNQPSGLAVASSISGFLFCGNAGNVITGFLDITGQNFNRFGSSDPIFEGFFDLAGLQIPNGATSAQYQLTVEAVDPLWSTHAGPYGFASQVTPSGSAQPILMTVTLGGDVTQNVLMQGSVVQKPQWYSPTSYASPVQLPTSGSWAGALSGYGDADFFRFSAQANRTLSVIVNATDAHNISESKAAPVVGMWALADPGTSPAPANTPSAFNTTFFGETRLDAQILQSTDFRLGIADYRGDGRPDYRYNARLLYGDRISPARASVAGGSPLTIEGLGLEKNTAVQVASRSTPVLASSATQLLVSTKAVSDGVYGVLLQDSASGGNSTMTNVLTVGAGPTDMIKLISGANPGTPVGGQAPSPFAALVVAADGTTPVAGASVQFSSSPAVGLSACAGGNTCTVLSDQSGTASTYMTPLSAGVFTLTAKLAPASYSNPQQVQTTLLGTSSPLDLVLMTPPVWIAQGATATLPVIARVLSNGTPVSGTTLIYQITAGNGTLSAASAITDSNGNASVNLQLDAMATSVRVSVCVTPNNSPCQILNATMVQTSSQRLQPVSGMLQIAAPGQSFQPVAIRVIDSAIPPHPVLGASVNFLAYIGRMPGNEPIVWAGEAGISEPNMPVILAKSQAAVQSDINGTATYALTTGGISGNVVVLGTATAGNSSVEFAAQQLGP